MNALNLSGVFGVAFQANKELAKTAAYFEAGRIINNKLVGLIVPKLPMMIRGYAQTAFGKLALANLFLVGVQKFKPENELLAKLGYAAVTNAYTEAFQDLNIEGLIDSFLGDSNIAKAIGLVDAAVAETAAQ
jgi:hypothetical protein